MNLKAIIHEADEGGYWAEIPALPGCVTQGESLDEIHANLKETAELWLSATDDMVLNNTRDKVLELAV